MSTTRTRDTQILADPDVPAIRIVREFDAPPHKVFQAHADAKLAAEWMGPNGSQMRFDHYDCRTGGAYRYVAEFDGEEYGFFGSFHDVRPGERIVQTFAFDGVPDGVSLETLVLEDLGDGRTRLTSTSMLESFEARDAMLASGMDVGVREGYQKLDALLAG